MLNSMFNTSCLSMFLVLEFVTYPPYFGNPAMWDLILSSAVSSSFST